MARTQASNLFVIGDADHRDFAAAIARLRERGAVRAFTSIAAALDALASAAEAPRWIYLLAAHRGRYTQAEVEALHRAAPLARIIAVDGSWCEGQPRSGRPLAGIARAYWHQFLPRFAAADADDHAGWRLPRTATPIDVSLRVAPAIATTDESPRVLVVAERRDEFEALADALASLGLQATSERQTADAHPCNAILLASRSFDEALAGTIRSHRERYQAPVIVLLDFPRQEEVAAALACGASAVVSKPFLLGDLAETLAAAGLTVETSRVRRAG